ncbi:MAG: ribosome small subunit-dependent GTPase A [Muribaculaceae bacterium]|nr:ribosome small subunit-dependent GTPase A [Muribaculaceae bacterium]
MDGQVVKITGSSCIVRTRDGQTLDCRVKGNFRIKGIRTTNPVAVGDNVQVEHREGETDYIVKVYPRHNYIIRRASNLSKECHILASNLDMAFLVVTIREPEVTTTFIDRFLATCEAYDVPASLVVNKSDLWDDLDREIADGLKYLYSSLGYGVIFTSAETCQGLEELREATRGKISLMGGNSGVGKSSLINALVPDADLRTGKISDIHHTGMHTTTFSEMVHLPYGGDLIDIPGVRGFGTIDFDPKEVSHYFPEIFEIGHDCRFSDCKHIGEAGCSVLPAVEEHRIAQSRYASYLSILEEATNPEGSDKYRKPF